MTFAPFAGILFIAAQILRFYPDHELAKSCKEVVNVLADYVRLIPPTIEELAEAKRGKSRKALLSREH